MARLAGKVAFVTGAGGGIGRALCERFLAEGAMVAAADIELDTAKNAVADAEGDGRAISIECDVGDPADVRESIAHTVDALGSINTLCNVAGGSSPQDGMVTDVTEEEFWRAIRLDLFGTFLCCKHGLPELIKAGGGSVINMASMATLIAMPNMDCYTASKGGVAALTRSLAVEYAPHRIRVNAIAPGIILTPRVKARAPEASQFAPRHVLGLGEPVDIANMAVYLASDESRIVTGQILSVDSGVTVT